MSRGNYLSLEEARNLGCIDQFAKEHLSEAGRARFNRLLSEMSKTTPSSEETSSQAHVASSSKTQIRRDTLKDAADTNVRAAN
ncbi:hypothetical protein [Methylocystis sp.]|uniref:hypothetical protein n=1 Tax=Methylocystis sp. TaxID=1911079 RepID=UPI003D0D9421